MSYVGNTPTTQSFISGTDYFNGDGSTIAFTLSRTVVSPNDIEAVVNNVVQQPNSAYTISGTTITFTSAPSAGTSNIYVRYLSTTTQSITPSQNTVSWNTLDSNIQQDLGLMYKNKIINGAMVIDQRNAGASVAGNNVFTVDRWYAYAGQSNKYTVQQNAGSVTPPAGFKNYLGVTSSSAYTLLSSDYFLIGQNIEGLNMADLNWGTANAQTCTLSFWVRSSLTGTFGGCLRNGNANYSYPFNYTISSANTWEKKSVTITGPTAGTWATDNTSGLSIFFGLGVGSSIVGPAGAWAAVNYNSATGSVSVVSTNAATWFVTGVQFEVGTQATTFTNAGGSYGGELALCQRYYYKFVVNNGVGTSWWGQATTSLSTTRSIGIPIILPVPARATPSITISQLFLVPAQVNTSYSVTAATVYSGYSLYGNAFALDMTTSGISAGTVYFLYLTDGGSLAYSMEL